MRDRGARPFDLMVRGRAVDSSLVQLLLKVLGLLAAPFRDLAFQLLEMLPRRRQIGLELRLLLLEFRPLPLVLRELLLRACDRFLDERLVLVRHLSLRQVELSLELLVLQRAPAVRLELLKLLFNLLQDDPNPLEVVLRRLSLALRRADVLVELRDPRDVVQDPAPV